MNINKAHFSALIAGVLFGTGLTVSQMVNPNKVLAFLDITGAWDPSLALVMAGAVLVSLLAYWQQNKMPTPWFSRRFYLPSAKKADASLITGAVLFGMGWGLAGLCPGPALASLWAADIKLLIFVSCMLLGLFLGSKIRQRGQ